MAGLCRFWAGPGPAGSQCPARKWKSPTHTEPGFSCWGYPPLVTGCLVQERRGQVKTGCTWEVVLFACHPEQAYFAQRRIWAIRAKRRALRDAIIARLDRFRFKLHHYPQLGGELSGEAHLDIGLMAGSPACGSSNATIRTTR